MILIDIDTWKMRIDFIQKEIVKSGKVHTSIFGVPRGGIPIACILAERLNLPLVSTPIIGTVVVDDLIDSGATKQKYNEFDFYTLYTKENQADWFEFWYEDTKTDDSDLIQRISERLGLKVSINRGEK